jgi:hypothetical protein
MVRAHQASILAALGLATVLAGCSPGPMIDRLPGDMGLPAGAPARSTTPYQYPAVHDMPPARATAPMSDEEQLKLEKELTAVRERQEAQEAKEAKEAKEGPDKTAAQPAKNPPAKNPPAKKKPASAKNGQAAGAKTSGAKTNP